MKAKKLVLCILLAVVLGCALFLVACKEKETPPPITILLEGELYRGASVPLSAELQKGITGDVSFEITQGSLYSYISGGALQVRNNAPYGSTITVRVSVGDVGVELSKTVGHTPVKEVQVLPVAPQKAGASVRLSAQVSPWYADDNEITYVLSSDTKCATLSDNLLTLTDGADKEDTLTVYAVCGGVQSEPIQITVTTVQPKELHVEATTTLQQGDSAVLSASIVPQDADVSIRYELTRTEYTDQYISFQDGAVSVKRYAPVGQFSVVAKAGALKKTLEFTVVKTDVTKVKIFCANGKTSESVRYNETVELGARVYPEDATYRSVTYSVSNEYEDYVRLQNNVFTVITKDVGVPIEIVATADGISDTIRFVTEGIPVESISLSVKDGLSRSVTVGESRTVQCTVSPADASAEVRLLLESGEEYATLVDNVLSFTGIGADNTLVRVMAVAENKQSFLEFHVVPIPVQEVVLFTTDDTTGLTLHDRVTLQSTVSPANASHREVTYEIVKGQTFGRLDGNIVTITDASSWAQIHIKATTADGVESNVLVLQVEGDVPSPTFSAWSDLDNRPLLLHDPSYANVALDLTSLPKNAADTVVIVDEGVQQLTILGGYDGTENSLIHNLYFYFLGDQITLYLRSVGIVIDNGFTDTVFDFCDATVTLDVAGSNYIAAGNAYCVSTNGFMLDGASDSQYAMRRNGMDGFAGLNGGDAVRAKTLIIQGEGDLILQGGDASSGTDGTAGVDETAAHTFAGNGGKGGGGGQGGHAIVCQHITYKQTGSVELRAGSSATGGQGGRAGSGATSAYNGVRGEDGQNGVISNAVAVSAGNVVVETVQPTIRWGGVKSNSSLRNLGTVADAISLFCNHYKIEIYYNNGWQNLHKPTLFLSGYNMTKQSDSTELFRQLRGMEYSLQVFGRNVLCDVTQRKSHAIRFYLCDSITTSDTHSTIYGLTDSDNNVWFSTFVAKPRDTFYSTYYNIMPHEMFHLLYYAMPEDTVKSVFANSVVQRTCNNGIAYNQSSQAGVYSGASDDAYFLTTYSKKNAMEDISETLSILCVQAQTPTWASADTPIAQKAIYFTQQFVAEYHSLAAWQTAYWMRHVR